MRASDNLEIIVHLLKERWSLLFYHFRGIEKRSLKSPFWKGLPGPFLGPDSLHTPGQCWCNNHWLLIWAWDVWVSPEHSSSLQSWNVSPFLWPVGFQFHTSLDWTGIRLLPGLWRWPWTLLPVLGCSRTSCSQGQWFFPPLWPSLQQHPWCMSPKPREWQSLAL